MYVDMCTAMCVNIYTVHVQTCVRTGASKNSWVHMCVDMCIDMCAGMCMDMCIDMRTAGTHVLLEAPHPMP